MKLGIVADEISRDFREAVRVGKSLGLERYEIRFLESGRAPMCDESELREVEAIANGENVEITALSPGLFKWTETTADFKREMSEVFPRAVELAKRWNLSNLITFGFRKPGATEEQFAVSDGTPEQIFDWFAAAAEKAAEHDLRLLVEPEPICWMDTATRVAEVIEKLDTTAIGINYDPGNVAWLTGSDPFGEFERVARYIGNVHVKDLRGIQDGKAIWAIPGEGVIDFQKHFDALRNLDYNGVVSLEPHIDGTAETTLRCKQAVERLWTNARQIAAA